MKRKVSIDAIQRRVPEGRTLPKAFTRFAKAATTADDLFEVTFTSADGLTHERLASTLLPFLRLGDGGIVALWYRDAGEPPIVHVDSEGGHRVVAVDFDDFLVRLALGRTGVEDIDGEGPATPHPEFAFGVKPSKPAALGALAAAFRRAVKDATPIPSKSVDGEKLRRELVRATNALVAKGAFPPHRAGTFWILNFHAKKSGSRWTFTPENDALAIRWPAMLAMTKDPSRAEYAVAIASVGLVSVDRDRQLLLDDPERANREKEAKALASRGAAERKAVVDATAKMVASGHYVSPLRIWIVELRATKRGARWTFEEKRGTKWGPSSHTVLERHWPALLALTKDPSRAKYAIKVIATGRIAVDDGRQLSLDP